MVTLRDRFLQYRHFSLAPIDRTSANVWLYKHLWLAYHKHKSSTSITYVACESMLRSVVRSSMHPCQGNWVAIGRAVIYYAWAAQALRAGIKCRHSRFIVTQRDRFLQYRHFSLAARFCELCDLGALDDARHMIMQCSTVCICIFIDCNEGYREYTYTYNKTEYKERRTKIV